MRSRFGIQKPCLCWEETTSADTWRITLLLNWKVCFSDSSVVYPEPSDKHILFYFQAMHKYSEEIYELALESFCALPLAAIMNKQFLCIHGGISPELQSMDDLRNVGCFTWSLFGFNHTSIVYSNSFTIVVESIPWTAYPWSNVWFTLGRSFRRLWTGKD